MCKPCTVTDVEPRENFVKILGSFEPTAEPTAEPDEPAPELDDAQGSLQIQDGEVLPIDDEPVV